VSSDQQITANRRNAQLSTGPRTSAGKAKVSVNALKHGLTGHQVVLPNENPDEFESFRTGLLADLAPRGDLEVALAERIVIAIWRLRRVPIFEAELHRRGFQEQIVKRAEKECRRYETTESDRLRTLLEKKEVAAHDCQAHEEARQRLAHARAQLDDPSFHVTHGLEMFTDLFSNLYRHEAGLARSMLRTLHELERLKAKRAGERVPPPSVVDVSVDLANSPLPVEGSRETDTTLD
jgi:hypothetical protein